MNHVIEIVKLATFTFFFAFILTIIIDGKDMYQRLESVIINCCSTKVAVTTVPENPITEDIVNNETVLRDILSNSTNSNIKIILNEENLSAKKYPNGKLFLEHAIEDNRDLQDLIANGNYTRAYEQDSEGNLNSVKYNYR